MNTTDIKIAVDAELRRINVPELAFHSDHEGWAVLLEEVEETKEEVVELEDATEVLKKLIFSDDCDELKLATLGDITEWAIRCAAEAVQVAAVAIKFINSKGEK